LARRGGFLNLVAHAPDLVAQVAQFIAHGQSGKHQQMTVARTVARPDITAYIGYAGCQIFCQLLNLRLFAVTTHNLKRTRVD
jgi:hypothetical protein